MDTSTPGSSGSPAGVWIACPTGAYPAGAPLARSCRPVRFRPCLVAGRPLDRVRRVGRQLRHARLPGWQTASKSGKSHPRGAARLRPRLVARRGNHLHRIVNNTQGETRRHQRSDRGIPKDRRISPRAKFPDCGCLFPFRQLVARRQKHCDHRVQQQVRPLDTRRLSATPPRLVLKKLMRLDPKALQALDLLPRDARQHRKRGVESSGLLARVICRGAVDRWYRASHRSQICTEGRLNNNVTN